ncbi:hypothetical protein ACOME3_003281 [Neoechinorhynchus agilis]
MIISGCSNYDDWLEFVSGYTRHRCNIAQLVDIVNDNESRYICLSEHSRDDQHYSAVHCIHINVKTNMIHELWKQVFPGRAKRVTASNAITAVTMGLKGYSKLQFLICLSTKSGVILEQEPIALPKSCSYLKADKDFLMFIERGSSQKMNILKLSEDKKRMVYEVHGVSLPIPTIPNPNLTA